MIDERERAKMSAVRFCGERVITPLAIWRVPTAITALQNLIDAAEAG